MIEVVPQNFSANIWGSPVLKFRLRPKTVSPNGAEKNLNACKIQTTGLECATSHLKNECN